MSSHEQKDPLRPGEEEALESLLRQMPPRTEPPAEIRARVRKAVEAEWRGTVARQKGFRQDTTRWGRPAVAAAASVALISLLLWFFGPGAADQAAAYQVTLEKSVGAVELNAASAWRPVTAGVALKAGQELVTGPGGRAQLAWNNGTTLRLDVNTRIAIAADDRVVLSRGAVYVDAGLRPASDGVPQVESRFGSTRHLGTQYEVRLAPQEMRVSVREGKVEVTGPKHTVHASAGEQLKIAATGAVQRESIDKWAPEWRWTQTVAPSFAIEQRPLTEFLAWVARETGRDLSFASAAAKSEAARIVLRGSVAGLAPDAAMAAVMATTPLGYTQDEGQITISAPAQVPVSP